MHKPPQISQLAQIVQPIEMHKPQMIQWLNSPTSPDGQTTSNDQSGLNSPTGLHGQTTSNQPSSSKRSRKWNNKFGKWRKISREGLLVLTVKINPSKIWDNRRVPSSRKTSEKVWENKVLTKVRENKVLTKILLIHEIGERTSCFSSVNRQHLRQTPRSPALENRRKR